MIDKIKTKLEELMPRLIGLRRELHRFPELGLEEERTGDILVEQLKELRLPFRRGIGKTGIVARYPASGEGPAVALRADMDGLPIQEETGLPFASQNPGKMHACGHDMHMAMVMGVAMLLTEMNVSLPGRVVFIFQPSEERPPGGAVEMINEGILEEERVKAIFALHVNPYLPAGMLGLRSGALMAAADAFQAKITGKGGHGASPHLAVDSISVASSVIQAWQQVVSRQVDPLEPAVLTVGTIRGGQEFNIIAETVEMSGTVRTLNEKVRSQMPRRIEEVGRGVAETFGARFSMEYKYGYPVLYNDPAMTDLLERAAREVNGKDYTRRLRNPTMGSDDFAYFLQKVPGTYAFLGARVPEAGEVYSWHSPHFVVNEEAITAGVALLARAVQLFFTERG